MFTNMYIYIVINKFCYIYIYICVCETLYVCVRLNNCAVAMSLCISVNLYLVINADFLGGRFVLGSRRCWWWMSVVMVAEVM